MRKFLHIVAAIGVLSIYPAIWFFAPHAMGATAARNTGEITSFPTHAEEINADDDVEFPQPSTIFVGTAGDVAVQPESGDFVVVFTDMPAGSIIPVLARRVMATDTTAGGFIRIW